MADLLPGKLHPAVLTGATSTKPFLKSGPIAAMKFMVSARLKLPCMLPVLKLRIEKTARLMVRHGLIKQVPDIQAIIYTPKP